MPQDELQPVAAIIADFRARARAGEPLTREQIREGLKAYRQERMSAADAAGKKKSSGAPVRTNEELLSLFNKPQGG